jgi:hypothetical protein
MPGITVVPYHTAARSGHLQPVAMPKLRPQILERQISKRGNPEKSSPRLASIKQRNRRRCRGFAAPVVKSPLVFQLGRKHNTYKTSAIRRKHIQADDLRHTIDS